MPAYQKRLLMKKLLVLLASVFLWTGASASHIMGGEITWECQANGQYVFTLKVYRDCNGISGQTSPQILNIWNYGGFPNTIICNFISQTDISPPCGFPCSNPTAGSAEEYVYVSNPVTLTGTPPANGWVFTWDDCCRNGAIDNLILTGGGSSGHTLRAIMYSYTPIGAPTANPADPCYDSSPIFLESPATVLCTGFPFTYNQNAFDSDLDSLYYDWDQPLRDNPWPATAFTFVAGYSFNSPFPGPTQNANNTGATLNNNTGEVSLTNYNPGSYVSVVRVEAWRCGQKIAEIFRDLQTTYLGPANCPGLPGGLTNNPPQVTISASTFTPVTPSLFVDTVFAGQTVTFNMQASDFDPQPAGTPSTIQNVTILASGAQFGAGFTSSTTGCLQPPCATLNPATPITNPIGSATTFTWNTDCSNLNYSNACASSNTYTFLLRATDDFCNAPAFFYGTFQVTVLPGVSDPAEVKCIRTLANGDVELDWTPPLDTGLVFNEYIIYHQPVGGGGYGQIGTIPDPTVNTFTHVGAPGGGNYIVRQSTGCGFLSQPNDTISPIELTVAAPPPGSVANLTWNSPFPGGLPATSTGYYYIYREFPAGTWSLLDSTQTTAYSDTVNLCNEFINYRVETQDTSRNCNSQSNVDGAQLADLTPPNVSPADSATVDINNNLASISYQATTATDAVYYIIYTWDAINLAWNPIDTVFDLTQTTYVNLNSNAANGPESYGVAVVDSCDNRSPVSSIQTTMHLSNELDACAYADSLWWTSYVGFPMASYNVYVSENSGPITLLGTTVAGDTTFLHSNLTPFSSYCYYIEAVGTGAETSRSNQLCIFADAPLAPQWEYMKFVTVDIAANLVDMEVYVDTVADVIEHRIERSFGLAGPYSQVGLVPQPLTGSEIQFQDLTANFNLQEYYYRVIAVDDCGADVLVSDTSNTIHLDVVANANLTNELSWNAYRYWDGGVESYNIYRWIDGIPNMTPLANVPGNTTTWIDNLNTTFLGQQGNGQFCYYVEAIEGAGNVYGYLELSTSNLTCVEQNPRMFIPNAFNPLSSIPENQVFKPSALFVDQYPYEMRVFDRWGKEVFYTTDSTIGWDGTYEGEDMPGGVYTYAIEYLPEGADEAIRYSGYVTLIR